MAELPPHLQVTLETFQANTVNGQCQVSLADLAEQRGLSPRTLHRHVAELEERGILSVHRRPGRPSLYRLTPQRPARPWIREILRRLLDFTHPIPSERHQAPPSDAGMPPTATVGREDILAALGDNAAKRRATLLVGPPGIGKSHILRAFSADAERSLYLEHVSPIKPALLNLAELLHGDGTLEVEGIEARYMEWEDVRKKITPWRVSQLAELVMGCMEGQDYILILDHLERVTPTMLLHLDALMGVALVMGAADEPSGRGLKPRAQRLWWAFERIEVPPLPREEARRLLWQVAQRDRVANPQLFETRVLQQAGGSPLAIITMAAKARTADLSTHEIRDLQHGAGTRYIPLTPVLLVIGAMIVAARFVALGLNDRDLYVLAGLGYAFFFFLRYFIYRID